MLSRFFRSKTSRHRLCSPTSILPWSSFLWLALGCGTEFDSIAQLKGLRVLGVQKSEPYAMPGQSVELELLYHDAVDEPRKIEKVWISGCENPPGDLYAVCFELLGPALSGQLPAEADGAPEDEPQIGENDGLSADELLRLGVASGAKKVAVESGFAFGFQDTFTLDVSDDVISSRPPLADPKAPAYGLDYVFFAVCAGELHLELGGDGFPLRCLDEQRRALGAEDFVVGYTAVYSYEDQLNTNPRITGFEIDGERLARDEFCVGSDCGILAPDPDRECGTSDPVVPVCESEDSEDCPELEFRVLVDPQSVDVDGVLSSTQEGEASVKEQMWVNYHTDRGEFTFDVKLVNDVSSGFNPDTETQFVSPTEKGPAQIWAVVRDNRGGADWARFQVCVE